MKFEYFFTVFPFTGSTIARNGLPKIVFFTFPDAEIQRTVDAIIQKSKAVIALGKKFMYRQMEMEITDAYR